MEVSSINHRIESENIVLRNEIIRLKRKVNHLISLFSDVTIDPRNLKDYVSGSYFEPPVKVKNLLIKHGCTTLSQLSSLDDNKLVRTHGVGLKTLTCVNHIVDTYRVEK